jgi:hypothetical protein
MNVTTRKKVARRFKESAGVVQMPKRPRVPTILIRGKKYVLSNYWTALGVSSNEEGPGARVIDTGGNDRFSFLWVYDTDRKMIAMWRHSEGNEKLYNRASQHTHDIVVLEKKGQLNRVTHEEMVIIEREMASREAETLRALKQTIEENATDWDRKVADILERHFQKEIYPAIDRRLAELEKGIVPFGFKYNDHIPKSREDQMKVFVVTNALSKFTEPAAYDLVSKTVGFDAYEPPDGGDGQAVQWAWHSLHEKTYDKYLR